MKFNQDYKDEVYNTCKSLFNAEYELTKCEARLSAAQRYFEASQTDEWLLELCARVQTYRQQKKVVEKLQARLFDLCDAKKMEEAQEY